MGVFSHITVNESVPMFLEARPTIGRHRVSGSLKFGLNSSVIDLCGVVAELQPMMTQFRFDFVHSWKNVDCRNDAL